MIYLVCLVYLLKMRFKLFSIDFTVSYLLICLMAISVLLGILDKFLFCFISVILHEIGHFLPMCKMGYIPQKVRISLFEINITDLSRCQRSDFENFIIIFFGPLSNFICFILFYLLYLIGNKSVYDFAFANLSVGLFNLLPVLSLDGGQLLYLILGKFFSENTAEKIVNVVTLIFIFPLFALGFVLLFNSKYNFSLLLVCIYMIFSLVCKNNRYY